MTITIVITCSGCDRTDHIDNINGLDWNRYMEGALVQDVWPDLSVNEREIIIGARLDCYTCPDCWDAIFADGGEDES